MEGEGYKPSALLKKLRPLGRRVCHNTRSKPIGIGKIVNILEIRYIDELVHYVHGSGFSSLDEWVFTLCENGILNLEQDSVWLHFIVLERKYNPITSFLRSFSEKIKNR